MSPSEIHKTIDAGSEDVLALFLEHLQKQNQEIRQPNAHDYLTDLN